jgi:hypothetical protein
MLEDFYHTGKNPTASAGIRLVLLLGLSTDFVFFPQVFVRDGNFTIEKLDIHRLTCLKTIGASVAGGKMADAEILPLPLRA